LSSSTIKMCLLTVPLPARYRIYGFIFCRPSQWPGLKRRDVIRQNGQSPGA
jgi:hypothetical protein